jgi:hypothetical protein
MDYESFVNDIFISRYESEQYCCYMHKAIFDEAVKQKLVYEKDGKWYTKYPVDMQVIIQ